MFSICNTDKNNQTQFEAVQINYHTSPIVINLYNIWIQLKIKQPNNSLWFQSIMYSITSTKLRNIHGRRRRDNLILFLLDVLLSASGDLVSGPRVSGLEICRFMYHTWELNKSRETSVQPWEKSALLNMLASEWGNKPRSIFPPPWIGLLPLVT